MFFEKKAHFLGNKTVNQRFGTNFKKHYFGKICCKFIAFLSFFAQKMLVEIYNTSFSNEGLIGIKA